MTKQTTPNQKGFTLIETIIYIALFAIIIGGGMVAAYQIIESTNASYNHIVLQEEANFLLHKINWVLTGATAVNVLPQNPGTTLQVTKKSTTYTFTVCNNNLTIQTGASKTCQDSPVILNSSSVKVLLASFQKISGTGGKPDGVRTVFSLLSIQNGRAVSQDFPITKYLP